MASDLPRFVLVLPLGRHGRKNTSRDRRLRWQRYIQGARKAAASWRRLLKREAEARVKLLETP